MNITNACTIDVEDYFQVQAFASVSKYENWNNYECRVEKNTRRVLSILNGDPGKKSSDANRAPRKATFFILGWIAERYPDLVREIDAAGHEIACHGYAHRVIYSQTKDEFRSDVRKAKAILEEITGKDVLGYRAPSYSITPKTRWALEILQEEGFRYDSSIFPVYHDIYGMPDAPRFPFAVSCNEKGGVEFLPLSESNAGKAFLEFPISTANIFGLNIPIAGGGYFRLFPYLLIKYALTRINKFEKQPFVFYLHPWEFDPGQPRISNAGLRSQFRHRINLSRTEHRFRRLVNEFMFSSLRDVISMIIPKY